MKLNSKVHGIIDYVFIVFVLLSPKLFGLPELTAHITYALGIIHLAVTLLTRFEYGLIKVIPFRIHGLIEFVVAIVLGLLGFFYLKDVDGDLACNYYLGLAVWILVVWFLTDFKSADALELKS